MARFLLVTLIILHVFDYSFAQETQKKLALIIGNSAYQHGGILKNPTNDAHLMAATLEDLGFDVIKKTDVGRSGMLTAFYDFNDRVLEYDVALFFYAGHGMQVKGVNYLIPVDARIENEISLEIEAFKVDYVSELYASMTNKTNIMILDACRDNPYRSWSRGGARGFATIKNQGAGTIISFAASAGQTASDGDGNNGLFTSVLVDEMRKPQNINQVFVNTRREVMNQSNNNQVPEEWNKLTGNFYFKFPEPIVDAPQITNHSSILKILTPGFSDLSNPYVLTKESLDIDGIAMDQNGLKSISVNGQDLTIDEVGHFNASINVPKNANSLNFLITDKNNKIETKSYRIKWDLPIASSQVVVEDNEIYTIVETDAQFPGGTTAFYEYVSNNMNYPAQAIAMGSEGKVYVEFVVEKDGSISNRKISKGLCASCDNEALRLVASAGRWSPGKQRGIAKRQRMMLPITFSLPEVNNSLNYGTSEIDIAMSQGKNYAFIIGVEDYDDPSITDLDNPTRDAEAIYDILTTKYTFEKENAFLFKNPTRDVIFDQMDFLQTQITDKDNLLIFYAGHGYWDESAQVGYWLPSDARGNTKRDWIRNSVISEQARVINSRNTLLVTDACFGGSIYKTMRAFEDSSVGLSMLYDTPSRKAITSGTLSEVPDKSVFMKYILKFLEGNEKKYFTTEQMFYKIKPAVSNNSANIPQFGVLQGTGDEGGDFVFRLRE